MPNRYAELTFTAAVRKAQQHCGTRAIAEKFAAMDVDNEHLTEAEVEFVAERDGFYLATVSSDGWPYVQFRGGPRGFLKALDDTTLGYADFGGNKQYISMGNLRGNDRASLFFMDYAGRRRLKVLARVEVHDAADRPDLVERLHDPDYEAEVERVVLFRVAAFNWNCPRHITPRFTAAEWAARNEAGSAD
jgi:predicted pyridoxine 5'-phosphate oxidase superfamily flavin-nucleotide-binding protein